MAQSLLVACHIHWPGLGGRKTEIVFTSTDKIVWSSKMTVLSSSVMYRNQMLVFMKSDLVGTEEMVQMLRLEWTWLVGFVLGTLIMSNSNGTNSCIYKSILWWVLLRKFYSAEPEKPFHPLTSSFYFRQSQSQTWSSWSQRRKRIPRYRTVY
jgi:hypothetical protein